MNTEIVCLSRYLRVAMLCLIMNTVPVSFGAVGMPLWFGLGELDLDPAMLDDIGRRTALLHACAAPVIPLLALRMVLPWSVIRSALPFVLLSITATMVPYVLAALSSVNLAWILWILGFWGQCQTV